MWKWFRVLKLGCIFYRFHTETEDHVKSVQPVGQGAVGQALALTSHPGFPPQAYRGVKRHHCYPPSWKRWAFFLFPGLSLALIAISIYAFLETSGNYYYTHSLWHALVASSVAFLLPPGDRPKRLWAWSRKLLCGYQICNNDREDLYAVT